LTEETVNRLNDLERKLTGVLTTRIQSRETTAEAGPRMPSWWRGDEEASQSAVLAMQQLTG
jgi:hypothetical protein